MNDHLSKNNHEINQCSFFSCNKFLAKSFREFKIQVQSSENDAATSIVYCIITPLNYCSWQLTSWKMSLKSSWKSNKKTSVTMTILDHGELKSHSFIWSEKSYRTVIMTNHDNFWFQQSPMLRLRPKMKVIFGIDWKLL